MLEECAPRFLFARLIGRNGFGDAVGSIEAAVSDDIQEITFMGSCLMWKMPLSVVVIFG